MQNYLMDKRYFLLLFIVLVTISYNLIHQNKQTMIQNYLNERTTLISSEYNFLYKKNKDIADLVFTTNLNKPEILNFFKNRQRSSLLNRLQNDYLELKSFNISQLHFHLPDNNSFLRMNKPLQYGDSLHKFRESIEFVNKYQKHTHGFEIGKTSDAFRFIYPMFVNSQYIGSVDISFSALSFVDGIKKHYDVKSNLHIEKKIVDLKVSQREKPNYIQSPIPQYYCKNSIIMEGNIDLKNRVLPKKYLDLLYSEIQKGKPFSKYLEKDLEVITYIPIQNTITKEVVAVFSFSSSNLFIDSKNSISNILFLTSVFVIAVVLFLIFKEVKYRVRLEVEVEDRTLNLQKLNVKLESLIAADTLTGANNRHYFYNVSKKMLSIAKREKTNLSIAVINIDKFKKINDNYGHKTGDKVLISLVETIKNLIRDSDIFVRFSGDEFVLLFPTTNLNNAFIISEKIRKAIEESRVEDEISFTISIGISELEDSSEDIESVLKKADMELYKAKKEGRNTISMSSI